MFDDTKCSGKRRGAMNEDIRGAKIRQIEIAPVSMTEIIMMPAQTVFVSTAFFILPSSPALPRDDGGVF